MTPLPTDVAIIGSSVARIAHERGRPGGHLAAEVVVTDSSPDVLARVAVLGFADGIEADAGRAVQDADCVMLCAPVGAYAGIAAAIAPHLAPGAVVTDVGSTKVSVIRDVAPLLPAGVRFIPAHPLAGTDVVDVGCGSGFHLPRFAGLGARSVVGVEPHQPLLELAREGAPEMPLLQPGAGR